MSDAPSGQGWNQGPGATPYPAQPMAPGPGGYGYAPAPKTNGMAIASLVTGILSIVMCPGFGIIGLITGYSARKSIRSSNGTESGEGLATGGIVMSYIGLVLIGLAIIAIVAVTFLGTAASSKFTPIGPTTIR